MAEARIKKMHVEFNEANQKRFKEKTKNFNDQIRLSEQGKIEGVVSKSGLIGGEDKKVSFQEVLDI